MRGPGAILRRLGGALALAALMPISATGLAAQGTLPPTANPVVLVVDKTRLFSDSAFGRASFARQTDAEKALEAENNRLQTELVAEEQQLTLLRKTLTAEDFSKRAEAFDQKVEQIRAEQDAKAKELALDREEDGKAFLAAIVPVLGKIMADRGALVILDKSDVIVSLNVIDVTDEAIARVDAVLGTPAAVAP